MPTYQYRCDRCGEQFDLRQSFSDDTLTSCPPTGGPAACQAPGEGAVKKVFSSIGITFKGDGFYKNDYGSNSSGIKKEKTSASASESNGSSSKSESSSSTKSSESSKSSDSGKSTAAPASASKASAD